MHWRLSLGVVWCGVSIPGSVLMAVVSPSYATAPCGNDICNFSAPPQATNIGEPVEAWYEPNLKIGRGAVDRGSRGAGELLSRGVGEKKRTIAIARSPNPPAPAMNPQLAAAPEKKMWDLTIARSPNPPASAMNPQLATAPEKKVWDEVIARSQAEQKSDRLIQSLLSTEPSNSKRSWDKPILQAQQTPPAPPVNPQPDPNRDRFPQPVPSPQTPPPEQQQPVLPTPTPPQPTPPQPTPPPSSEQKITVKKIEVTGSTLFKPEEINAITGPVEGTTITLEELRKVADSITQLYLDKGYITSRAVLASQQIEDGVVKILVIEGSLERIEIEGAKRINPNYIRSRLLLGAGVPLSTAALENQLRLLRIDPLFENIEASLRASDKVGQSILTVRVTEANRLITNFSIDNYSPPSVGSERVGAFVLYRNLTGIGDEISTSFYKSLGDSNVYDLSYRAPINAMNGTIQLRFAPNNNEIVQEPFKALGISGESELYEISYRQPLKRSPQEEFALSLGFTHQRGQTFTLDGPTPFGLGPDDEGITRSSVFKFGQDYLRRDASGAWVLRSQFSFGTGLFNATINEDPIPDSRFISWTGQVQRVQRLNNDNLLIVQTDLQLSPNSLLPSQQFVIGGGLSLRGYRQNARSGDIGFRFSVEDRYTVQRDSSGLPILQFAPFIDLGAVKNVGDNPNPLPDDRFLIGVGLGVIWEVLPGLNVRVDYALPLVELSDKGDNAQDAGFYFSVNYSP